MQQTTHNAQRPIDHIPERSGALLLAEPKLHKGVHQTQRIFKIYWYI